MAGRQRLWSHLVLVYVLALATIVGSGMAGVSPVAAADDGQQVGYRIDPFAQDAYAWRAANKKTKNLDPYDPYRNVASFYVDGTGVQGLDGIKKNPTLTYDVLNVETLRTQNPALYQALNLPPGVRTVIRFTSFNVPGVHSEAAIAEILKKLGIDFTKDSRLLAAYSERQPCSKCEAITRYARQVRWSYQYGTDKQNMEATQDLAVDFYWLRRTSPFAPPTIGGACPTSGGPQAAGSDGLVLAAAVDCGPAVPGSDEEAGALQKELAKPEVPGGIDFSTLQLRYVADTSTSGGRGLNYGFVASDTTGAANRAAGLDVLHQASDALFVWLELQPETFTVNLNPNEPDRIVDADLGRTDVGRVLLEADFQMKKTVAGLIHPDTPVGAQFWQQLQAGSDGSTCLSMRQWIVPAPATVREVSNQLYILDAPLSVELESDYLKVPGVDQYSCSSSQDQAVQQHNEAVFRSMILPQVQKAVNEAPEYAALRRVYLSRVAAEWYRQRSATQRTAYAGLIDRGDVNPWVSRDASWTPKIVFDQYVQSYKNGEFNVTHQTQHGNVIEIRTYVYGGVDFTRIPELKIAASQFDAKWPGLQGRVQRSFDQPVPDPNGTQVWLGGDTVVRPPTSAPGPFPLAPVVIGAAFLLAVVAVSWLIARATRPRQRPA